jgi:hypothetical protein
LSLFSSPSPHIPFILLSRPNSPISQFPNSHPDAVYGDLLYVDADDISKVRRVWKSGSYHPKKWFNGWMPPHPALFVTRELAERVGDYRLDLGSAADKGFLKSVRHNCI